VGKNRNPGKKLKNRGEKDIRGGGWKRENESELQNLGSGVRPNKTMGQETGTAGKENLGEIQNGLNPRTQKGKVQGPSHLGGPGGGGLWDGLAKKGGPGVGV